VGWRRILWISGVVAALLLVIIWVYPNRDDFSAANTSWNGADDFCAQFEASTIDSLSSLPTQPSGTTLVLIPYTPFTAEELEELKDYVSGGGTLLVMDDYGYGNEVLEHLGLRYRFSGAPLLDPLINYKNAQFPKIVNFTGSPLTQGVDAVMFNHATCLMGVPEDEVIATSSSFSFVDVDGNASWDEEIDEKGPFAVAANTEFGQGQVIAIADPSILINSMIGMEDNRAFLRNAIDNPQILLDESHLTESALTQTQEGLGVVRNAFSYPLAILGVIGVVLFLTWRPVWRR
jgi:hypothetical protein